MLDVVLCGEEKMEMRKFMARPDEPEEAYLIVCPT